VITLSVVSASSGDPGFLDTDVFEWLRTGELDLFRGCVWIAQLRGSESWTAGRGAFNAQSAD
jgi:hypothetical protein